ncbi:MAG: Ser-Thr-rich GPI-anchored membrane family protein, partial [Rhodothermales bacterium]
MIIETVVKRATVVRDTAVKERSGLEQVVSVSERAAKIAGTGISEIIVISPNGGEQWRVGQEEPIEWNATGGGDVHIELRRGNGELVRRIYRVTDGGYGGSTTWTVPPYIEPGSDYYIETYSHDNPEVRDTSDGYFTILAGSGPFITALSPDSGDKWIVGEDATIRWTSRNVTGAIAIRLLKGEAETARVITSGTTDDGMYTWTVPGNLEPRNDYYISIRSAQNPSVWDTNPDFEIGFQSIHLVGHFDTEGAAWDVDVESNYAYVADYDGGLRIFDVSNPFQLYEMGSYNTPGHARTVDVESNYAYVADYDGGLR